MSFFCHSPNFRFQFLLNRWYIPFAWLLSQSPTCLPARQCWRSHHPQSACCHTPSKVSHQLKHLFLNSPQTRGESGVPEASENGFSGEMLWLSFPSTHTITHRTHTSWKISEWQRQEKGALFQSKCAVTNRIWWEPYNHTAGESIIWYNSKGPFGNIVRNLKNFPHLRINTSQRQIIELKHKDIYHGIIYDSGKTRNSL